MGMMEKKMETTIYYLGFRVYSPPEVDRIWLWVYYNKIRIYPQGDFTFLPQSPQT